MKIRTIWFDISNVPHVNFFLPIIQTLEKKYNLIFTLREFAETKGLFEKKIRKPYKIIGKHKGGNKFAKIFAVFERTLELLFSVGNFDLKISVGGDSSNLCAKMRGGKSITFDDNETAPNWRYSWLSDFAFWPESVPIDILHKHKFKDRKLFRYNGFKEDIYVADYSPDPSFLNMLPFDEYVVIRPENIQANYVNNKQTIVPELMRLISQSGFNILFLPRYNHDREYGAGIKNIIIPDEALNGLDVCYYSQAVLTGAGTFAREAACLGIPSISFFAGKQLLAVDQKMIRDKKIFFSRDPHEIVEKLKKLKKHQPDLKRSKRVQEEVISKLKEVINDFS